MEKLAYIIAMLGVEYVGDMEVAMGVYCLLGYIRR